MATRKVKVPAPRGRDPEARRFNRQLAIVAREKCPPEIMIDYLLAILAGHADASIEQDEATEEWGIFRPEHGHTSTPEHRMWAWTQLRQAGYGMPAQHHVIEGEIRQHVTSGPALNLAAINPAKLHAARAALLGLQAPGPDQPEAGSPEAGSQDQGQDQPEAIDAEFTEMPADTADRGSGDSGQGEDGMSESAPAASADE